MSYSVHDNYVPWTSPTNSIVDYPPEPDSFSQTESNIGPTRVTTRGQRRLASQRPLIRSSSRPQSPLIMPTTTTTTTYPLTPDSTSYSSYSTYHSRSSSNPRSTSPALSISTSISSRSHSGSTNNHLGPFDRNCYSPAASPSHQSESPVTSNPQTRPKQRKQRLFNVDRRAICQFHLDHPTARQEDIANKFRVERSTISKILKFKSKWLNVKPEESLKVAKHRPSKFPQLEAAMIDWISEPATTRKALSDTRLREKALALAKSIGIGEDKFKASSGWVENFKHRHGIRNGTYEGNGRNQALARALGKSVEGMEDILNASKVEDDSDKRHKGDNVHAYSPISPTAHNSFTSGVLGSHTRQHHGNSRPSYRRASWTGCAINEHVDGDGGMGPHSQHSPQLASHPHQNPSHQEQHLPSTNNSSHLQRRYQEHCPTTYQQDSYSYERQSHTSPVTSSSQSLGYPSQTYPAREMQPSAINADVPPQTSPSSSSMHQVQQPTPTEGPSHPTLAYPESQHTLSHNLILPDNSPPSDSNAGACLDRFILYVDTDPVGRTLLTPEQRRNLDEIRCVVITAGTYFTPS